MILRKKALPVVTLIGILLPLVHCQPPPYRSAPVESYKIRILTDAMSVRTRGGERLDGYLAEYVADFEKHRIFIALEIQKYVKDERLTVTGKSEKDAVRMSFGVQPETDFPVFEINKAEPTPVEKRPEEIKSAPRARPRRPPDLATQISEKSPENSLLDFKKDEALRPLQAPPFSRLARS
jgi:hypothetical protein